MADWCTIESDPGVFTELITKIGVKDVQVEELYSIEDNDFEGIKPVYGLIFLFKWQQDPADRQVNYSEDPDMFFAKQVINNACATQALLSILLNSSELDVGEDLQQFKSFTMDFPSDMRGEAIASLDQVRTAHNSFARPEPFMQDEKRVATEKDDVFHFIAYIPFKGKVYELDGLKPAPIVLGDINGDDWLASVRPHIQERIFRYASSEIRFNLMAIIKDQRVVLQDEIDARKKRVEALQQKISLPETESKSSTLVLPPEALGIDKTNEFNELLEQGNKSRLENYQALEGAAIQFAESKLSSLKQKFARWKEENIRRKHNYIPFAVALLKQLASKGKLTSMVEKATEISTKRRADAAAAKAKKEGSKTE